jgi:DNA-directed RNA polymerase III subunit RPC11
MYKNVTFDRKEAAEVESEKNWANEDSEVLCPKCFGKGAWFYEQQTRSADEPATIFFKCKSKECSNQWKVG